jgi:hypothetical protein
MAFMLTNSLLLIRDTCSIKFWQQSALGMKSTCVRCPSNVLAVNEHLWYGSRASDFLQLLLDGCPVSCTALAYLQYIIAYMRRLGTMEGGVCAASLSVSILLLSRRHLAETAAACPTHVGLNAVIELSVRQSALRTVFGAVQTPDLGVITYPTHLTPRIWHLP